MTKATVFNLLTGIADALKAAMPDLDTRVQLDPFDVDRMMETESFRSVAARIVFGSAEPVQRAGGAYDLNVGCGIFLAASRQGRPDHKKAGADLACVDRALASYRALATDPYVGLTELAAIELKPMRVFASELTNDKGFALVAIEIGTVLYDVIPPRGVIGTFAGVLPENWTRYAVNGSDPQPLPETLP